MPSRHPLLVDAGIALLFAAVSVVTAISSAPPGDAPTATALALLAGGALALVARRRAPVAVLVVTCLTVVAYSWLDQHNVAGVSVLLATYTAVQAGHRWLTVAVIGAALSAAMVHTVTSGGSVADAAAHTLVLKGWLLASGVLGEVVREQRLLAEQADGRAMAAERAREETARRQAGEERLRIARELHDSLTHSISIIAVQANVAAHLARKRGEAVDPAMLAIQEASAQATRELRATLEVLREARPTAASIEELPRLIEGAGRAGVSATVTIAGEPVRLSPEVDGAAYRIVQEALTNVARHAGPASATVHLGFDPEALTVQVDDDGGPAPAVAPTAGVGLLGMRERVDALGGHVDAGPRPDGGFRVRASLPLRTVTSAEAPA